MICSNDKLNYYKFGLGLGAMAAPVQVTGKKIEGGAAEAAAGGADQSVKIRWYHFQTDTIRFITTDLARFCDTLAAL